MKSALYLLLLGITFAPVPGNSQNLDPVVWDFTATQLSNDTVKLDLNAQIEDGWYIYSQYLESEDGPIPTSFQFNRGPYELIGKVIEHGEALEGMDEIFQMKLIKYTDTVRFSQHIILHHPVKSISGILTFMTCDDLRCLPPREIPFDIALK